MIIYYIHLLPCWGRMKRRILLSTLISLLLFLSLAGVFSLIKIEGYDVSRDEIMEIAEAYQNHRWVGTTVNIRHDSPGPQPKTEAIPQDVTDWISESRWGEGPIDTPDRDTYTEWPSWKGWAVGENVGIPYKWLGWSSIDEFDLGIRDGKYAGDINFVEGNDLVVGVDCAGFVSRCWQLPYDHTTRMLYDVSQPIRFEDLKEGDILDRYGHHVMLFKEFVSTDQTVPNVTRIRVIEATGYDWKVNEWEYLLVGMDVIREEWYGIPYTTSSITLELASGPLNGSWTGPYVPRTRSAIALYIGNIVPRHRNWFIIFTITSLIIGFTASYLINKKRTSS